MRFRLLAILLLFGLRSFAQSPTLLHVTINGKGVEVPRTRESRTHVYYTIDSPFVEHDTTFLFRQYVVEKCTGCDLHQIRHTHSYYIAFAKERRHIEHAHAITRIGQCGSLLDNDSLLNEQIAQMDEEPIYNDLQDIPRRWYHLVEYDNRFFLSVDRPYQFEFADNLIVNYGDEAWVSRLTEFRKHDKKSYSYRDDGRHCTIVPSKKVKGLYILTTHTQGGDVVREAVCPEEALKNFDIIDSSGTAPTKTHFGHYTETDFDNL